MTSHRGPEAPTEQIRPALGGWQPQRYPPLRRDEDTVVRSPLFADEPAPAPRRKVFPRGWRDVACALWALAAFLACVVLAEFGWAFYHMTHGGGL